MSATRATGLFRNRTRTSRTSHCNFIQRCSFSTSCRVSNTIRTVVVSLFPPTSEFLIPRGAICHISRNWSPRCVSPLETLWRKLFLLEARAGRRPTQVHPNGDFLGIEIPIGPKCSSSVDPSLGCLVTRLLDY